MARKTKSKNLWINEEIYLNFRRAIEADGFRYGITARVEEILKRYTQLALKKHGMEWKREIPEVRKVGGKGILRREEKYGT